MSIQIAIEGRHDGPWQDMLLRLRELVGQLDAIDGVEAEIHITIDVKVGLEDDDE